MRLLSLLRSVLAPSCVLSAVTAFSLSLVSTAAASAAEMPKLVKKDGRYALMVDGKPYPVLGGQIHNSSAWPAELDQVWKSMEALHANTVEAPVYWEQFERTEGQFDYSNVDALLEGARAHRLHLVVLWFGTWKNGNNHYVPAWVKADTKRFPRTIRPDGEPIDVMSPLGKNTQEADTKAFVALMKHLKEKDGDQHTTIMIQVENESGNIGSIRDNSPEANKAFAGKVPADLLAAEHKQAGTWSEVFPGEADEVFQAYHQAKYMNAIAAAGKAEFPIPYYCNVWIDYPPSELPQRVIDTPGIGYPSGGPVQKRLGMWRALATSIDLIGPDLYSDDPTLLKATMATYHRPDNALWIPETGRSDNYAKWFIYALGQGAIGFSPFGVDQSGWNITGDEPWPGHAQNFALIEPINRPLAELSFEGKLKTAIEEPGMATQEVDLGVWQATVAFGFPQRDGKPAPGTKNHDGEAVIAQVGPDEFLVTGKDVSVTFHLPGKMAWMRSEVVTAEQGSYEGDTWKPVRMLNGDETDRGFQFHARPTYVRVKMGRF